MTDSFEIRFLLVIRESKTLLEASRKLRLTPSAVTQRLQQMEKKLDVRLLDRSARGLRFTDEGELLCVRGAELLQQFDALMDDLHERRRGFVGKLKINAPFGFGRQYVAPAVAAFKSFHPEVEISLYLSDQPMVETSDRFDVVIHIGQLGASNLVCRTLAPNRRFICASPAFIAQHGLPDSPGQLANYPCIALHENNEDVTLWHLRRGRETQSIRIKPSLSSNDGNVIRQWGCDGQGIILRSEWDVADALKDGSLVRLLPTWKLPDADIVALTHQREGLPERVRNFMRFLQDTFMPAPPWRA
ncbi:LysR family transcriptional regulator [Prodigiosinella confusarubida]|uniref:LysR family transcriptional regulator n=1 Tax=Serratia sp. (strain ATCC 39006) TaxID=104623 RepID=A0A2I5TMI3_SERS3|nr:LysR family transcriptional regulator [Serratia sp. ATCC 39006]AUH01448.1 LysR family transcriptional regulator [Serratia sp. ATCC 39006]AUH05770.1 LysR family transcriptional regulator [Serratia sp. ATCC 39006]